MTVGTEAGGELLIHPPRSTVSPTKPTATEEVRIVVGTFIIFKAFFFILTFMGTVTNDYDFPDPRVTSAHGKEGTCREPRRNP